MRRHAGLNALAALALLVGASPDDSSEVPAGVVLTPDEIRQALTHSPVPPLPPDETNRWADDPAAARLGAFLFFDTELSRNGELSCASCHDPARAFTDGRSVSKGLGISSRNSPTLLNVGYNRWFFWDGRADSTWSQAIQPLESPIELGGDRTAIAHRIARDPALASAWEDVFGPLPPLAESARFPDHARPIPDKPEHPHHRAWLAMEPDDRAAIDRVLVHVGKALAAYERRLLSVRAPFDVFVEGLREDDPAKLAALSESAQRGFRLFAGRGSCRTCHFGPRFTDGEFHNIGVPPLGKGHATDAGRYQGAKDLLRDPFNAAGAHSDDPDGPRARTTRTLRTGPESWGEFKTPSLRNLVGTAPYMHQGQLADLPAVLRFYTDLEGVQGAGHHGESILSPFGLSKTDRADFVAFLESLTDGEVDPALTRPPDLAGSVDER